MGEEREQLLGFQTTEYYVALVVDDSLLHGALLALEGYHETVGVVVSKGNLKNLTPLHLLLQPQLGIKQIHPFSIEHDMLLVPASGF